MNEVNGIIAICDQKKVMINDIKNKIKLAGSFQSSITESLHSMFAQMEGQLISERTKQGLFIAKQKRAFNRKKKDALKK
jgi:DNA invertase Pin-like site-specific DNA recombinase